MRMKSKKTTNLERKKSSHSMNNMILKIIPSNKAVILIK